jgi:hypothetical protein
VNECKPLVLGSVLWKEEMFASSVVVVQHPKHAMVNLHFETEYLNDWEELQERHKSAGHKADINQEVGRGPSLSHGQYLPDTSARKWRGACGHGDAILAAGGRRVPSARRAYPRGRAPPSQSPRQAQPDAHSDPTPPLLDHTHSHQQQPWGVYFLDTLYWEVGQLKWSHQDVREGRRFVGEAADD